MIFLLIVLFAGTLFAQNDSIALDKFAKVQSLVAEPQNVSSGETMSLGTVLLQMGLGLAVIGVLFAILIYLVKKFNLGKNQITDGADFQVLQTFYLASNQKILTVKIYEKIYLLSVSANGVQRIDDDVHLPEKLQIPNQESFVQTVDKMLEKYKKGFSFNPKGGKR